MVAAMGREVVAVDAMADNLAYIRASLEVGNNTEKVVLVHNAIRQLFIQEHKGSNKLLDEKDLQNYSKVSNNNQPDS